MIARETKSLHWCTEVQENGNHLFYEIPSDDKTMADFMLDVQLWKNEAN